MLTTTTHESEPSDGTMCTQEGPGGAGLTRATAQASLRCPRCDEEMPDTDQLLAHPLSSGSRSSRPGETCWTQWRCRRWPRASRVGRRGGGVVQDGGGTAGRGLGEGSDRPGGANEGAGRGDIPQATSGYSPLFWRPPRAAMFREREDPGDHPGTGGPHTFKDKVLWCTCKEQYKNEGKQVQIAVTQSGQESMELMKRREEKNGQSPRSPPARHLVKLLKDMGHWEERK